MTGSTVSQSTTLPLEFPIGKGQILTGHKIDMQTGEILIFIVKNSTNITLKPGQMITKEERDCLVKQLGTVPDVVFKFTDLDMAIKFYSGFFKEYPTKGIERLKEKYLAYQQCICA